MIGVSRRHTIIMCSGSNITAYLHLLDASCTRFYRLCPQTLPVSVQGKGRVQTNSDSKQSLQEEEERP